VANLIKRFKATCSVKDLARPGRPRSICTKENKQVVESAFSQNPQKSTRRAKQELDISRTSTQRMLHDLKLKPYHSHLLHAMTEDDPDRRVEFSKIFRQKCAEDDTFPEKIVWSDNASFNFNGHVSRHNTVYWASENPHAEIQKDVNTPGTASVV
jgi:hypothetical protein